VGSRAPVLFFRSGAPLSKQEARHVAAAARRGGAFHPKMD